MRSPSSERILLQPIRLPGRLFDSKVVEKVSLIFKRPVAVEPRKLELDDYYDAVRDQYHSTGILKHFIAREPQTDDRHCFVVGVDLFIPILTFVFGEAHVRGRHAIVSTHRLAEEFYMREPDEALLKERLLKEIVHEIGHNFGLVHCVDDLCVMHSSWDIADTDRKSCYPCDVCFQLLDEVL